MERIGVRELRQHATRYLGRVKAGETVEVTERGRLVALLVPPTSGAREQLIADGRLIPAPGPRRLPQRVSLYGSSKEGVPAPTTRSVLDEARADRL